MLIYCITDTRDITHHSSKDGSSVCVWMGDCSTNDDPWLVKSLLIFLSWHLEYTCWAQNEHLVLKLEAGFSLSNVAWRRRAVNEGLGSAGWSRQVQFNHTPDCWRCDGGCICPWCVWDYMTAGQAARGSVRLSGLVLLGKTWSTYAVVTRATIAVRVLPFMETILPVLPLSAE